ncbi:interleukin-11 receptor subunit alpha isoform X2 [Mugil cephalus]|nr:interleukin-11 receptor subunit alpha isoform X2 [Mugil cephalus]
MPGLLSSPVCLTVIWFLSWSLRSCSSAQIWTDEVSDVQYGRLESNVTLACGKSQIRTPVVWYHNRSAVLPRHQVTSDGRLVLLHADQSAQGNYSCYNDSGLLLHSVKLRLGHPPGLLSISCQVPNHSFVRCSWEEHVKTFLPAKYNASFKGTGLEWRPCIVNVAIKHCDVELPAFWQTFHTLRITQTNDLGSETTYARFKLHELLKPNPPESVSVKEQDGFPKKLVISWNIPSSWPVGDAFPLMFHVRYRPHGSMYWSEIYSSDSEVVVLDALAGHVHQVQVRARDDVNSESQWSEWTPMFFGRPWAAYTTPDPVEDPDDFYTFNTTPETPTENPRDSTSDDEGNVGLMILLVSFSVVILTTVLSLIFIVWLRQRRRDHATIQERASGQDEVHANLM